MAEAMPSFVVHLGPYLVATNTLRTAPAETSVSRVAAERGEQVLRVMVPEKSAGGLCLHQVSITQP